MLSMIASVMTDPFASIHAPAILSAAKALNSCISHCWPRMVDDERTGEVLRMIVMCWLSMHTNETGLQVPHELLIAVDGELKLAVRMIRAIYMEKKLPMPNEIAQITQREPRLVGILNAGES
jgi:hypothetical protein